jgi:glycosyltransferase involved in cell wall biosynthesis
MKVSVIIPVYNTARYIERCLYSVLEQRHKDLEIIVVDDCGKDNSMEIAAEVLGAGVPVGTPGSAAGTAGGAAGARPAPLFLRHECNRGLSAARNTGLHSASGEYVFFLDSDDEIPPGAIANLTAMADRYKDVQLVAGAVDVLPRSNEALGLHNNLPLYTQGNYACAKAVLRREIPIMACNKLIKRDFILQHNLFFKEGLIHEDNEWSFRMAEHLTSLAITRQITYMYHMNSGGLTLERLSSARVDSLLAILDSQINTLSANPLISSLQKSYILFTAAWMIHLMHTSAYPTRIPVTTRIRHAVKPLSPGLLHQPLKDISLYLLIHMPPAWLGTAKSIMQNVKKT